MGLMLRGSGLAGVLFLCAAGFARGDLVPASDGLLRRGEFGAKQSLPAAVDRATNLLSMDIPSILSQASEYWEELYARRAKAQAVDIAQLFGGKARLNNAELVWQALVENERTPQILFAELQTERPWGTATLPARLANNSPWGRSSSSGSSARVARPDAGMLEIERREPWSRAAAAFYRGLIAMTAMAIVVVFWLRDQMKAQPRQMA